MFGAVTEVEDVIRLAKKVDCLISDLIVHCVLGERNSVILY
jgi:hypothetical protein